MPSLYDQSFPLTFEPGQADEVPIFKSAVKNASRMPTPLYGLGVVLPGDWCRYKATELGATAQNSPMSVWFKRFLIKRAKAQEMKLPDCLPKVCDRNLRICLVTYKLNFRREQMVGYSDDQQKQDFETLCILLGATTEEKQILEENWKWHRVPCSEVDLTDTPLLPHTRARRLALEQ